LFPTAGFQIITEPCSPEDSPRLGSTRSLTDSSHPPYFEIQGKSFR